MHCTISDKKFVTYKEGFPQKEVVNRRGNYQKQT